MIWREDMLLSEIPEFTSYPTVSAFVKDHLEMQFGDVRSMLRLPLPALGITYACNFAAAAVLCNLIGGISASLFKPTTPVRGVKAHKVSLLTFISSPAIADAIEAEGGEAQVRWPNDVLLASRKVAGVMAELQTIGEKIGALVLGMDVNVNVGQNMLDRALGEAAWGATSLKAVLGREIDGVAFAATLLESLERRYDRFLGSEGKALMAEWKARSCLGQRALVIDKERRIEGIAADIDESGCLLVQLDDRALVRVFEGEMLPLTHG